MHIKGLAQSETRIRCSVSGTCSHDDDDGADDVYECT